MGRRAPLTPTPATSPPAEPKPAPKRKKPASPPPPPPSPPAVPPSPEEAAYIEAIGARNIFDSGAARKPDPQITKPLRDAEEKRAREEAMRQNLQNVRELREAKQIGAVPLESPVPGSFSGDPFEYMGQVRYPSLQPQETPTGKEYKGWAQSLERWWNNTPDDVDIVYPEGVGRSLLSSEPGRYTAFGVVKTRDEPPPLRMPTDQDLADPNSALAKVEALGNEYREARRQYRDLRADTIRLRSAKEAAVADTLPALQKQDTNQFLRAMQQIMEANNALPEKAAQARQALRRVLKLRAEMQEHGWMDDKELNRYFGPK